MSLIDLIPLNDASVSAVSYILDSEIPMSLTSFGDHLTVKNLTLKESLMCPEISQLGLSCWLKAWNMNSQVWGRAVGATHMTSTRVILLFLQRSDHVLTVGLGRAIPTATISSVWNPILGHQSPSHAKTSVEVRTRRVDGDRFDNLIVSILCCLEQLPPEQLMELQPLLHRYDLHIPSLIEEHARCSVLMLTSSLVPVQL
jgi:hypothetical protein